VLPKNKQKFTRKRRSKNTADGVKSYQEQKAAAKEKEEERHAAVGKEKSKNCKCSDGQKVLKKHVVLLVSLKSHN